MRLTDRTTATAVTKKDFIHIVITGDTSQSPQGSSYKAQLGQIPELYKLPTPTIRLSTQINPSPFISVPTLNRDNTVGSDVDLVNPPVIITDNVTQEQLDNHLFIEMVQYKKKRGRGGKVNGGGYVIQPRVEPGLFGGVVNVLQERIMNYYGKKITTRGGIQYDSKTGMYLSVNRENHYEIYDLNQFIDVSNYFRGKFCYFDLTYINQYGSTDLINVPIPYSNISKSSKQKILSGNSGSSYRLCYCGQISSLYVAFRYLMFDPEANGGKGQFIEGPLSQTIKVCNQYCPVLKTSINGECTVNSAFTTSTNNRLIKFSFIN